MPRAKKRFGQHFLVDSAIIDRIVATILPTPADKIVEIGPGQGALTEPLIESGASVCAVEYERDAYQRMEARFGDDNSLTLINADFLKITPSALPFERFKLVGNLPYNITSPIIEWTVTYRSHIESAVFMIQKEVALRLSSQPGQKDWSPLAILTGLFYQIEHCFDVPPDSFSPPPKVVSSVAKLTPKEEAAVPNFDLFEKLVRTAFTQRRKLLVNNLVPALIATRDQAVQILSSIGLNEKVRAEEVPTEKFLELTELLNSYKIQ